MIRLGDEAHGRVELVSEPVRGWYFTHASNRRFPRPAWAHHNAADMGPVVSRLRPSTSSLGRASLAVFSSLRTDLALDASRRSGRDRTQKDSCTTAAGAVQTSGPTQALVVG